MRVLGLEKEVCMCFERMCGKGNEKRGKFMSGLQEELMWVTEKCVFGGEGTKRRQR